jgi:voltage-gated potassium channel
MADLAASGGRVKLNERAVLPEEIGQPLAAITTGLGVRIYRDDRPVGFWEPEAKSLQSGDVIIEIAEGNGPRIA